MKRGREYQSCGEDYKRERKRDNRGKQNHLLNEGCWEEYNVGTINLGKIIKISKFKNEDWEEYQVLWNFIHPWQKYLRNDGRTGLNSFQIAAQLGNFRIPTAIRNILAIGRCGHYCEQQWQCPTHVVGQILTLIYAVKIHTWYFQNAETLLSRCGYLGFQSR